MLIDLGAEEGLDPGRAGSKAAWLGMALRAGLPVLPGVVVPVAASRRHMAIGAEILAEKGSGAARLAVMATPIDFTDELISAGERLGAPLVARSSTVVEASGDWSGAFTSYLDLTPDQLPKGVTGCWASAYSVASLDRQTAAAIEPGSIAMAVLIQPALDPKAGGLAWIDGDDRITVHAVEGSPAPLLQGWSNGFTALWDRAWGGAELIDLLGVELLDELAETLRRAKARTGANRMEWGVDNGVWVLQLGEQAKRSRDDIAGPSVEAIDPRLAEVARMVAHAPGALGEELVLPWALAGGPELWSGREATPMDRTDLRRAASELTAQVWGRPPDQSLAAARRLLARLRGPDPSGAIEVLSSLREPDPEAAGSLLAGIDALVAEAFARGGGQSSDRLWHEGLDFVERHADGKATLRPGRLGLGRWEPFLASVTLALGAHHPGVGASPGVGAGIGWEAGAIATLASSPPRRTIVAEKPIPNLAPLLWDAAALVTRSGSAAAHLFDSARSLGVAAVCNVEVPKVDDHLVAVDGHTGIVAMLSLKEGEDA